MAKGRAQSAKSADLAAKRRKICENTQPIREMSHFAKKLCSVPEGSFGHDRGAGVDTPIHLLPLATTAVNASGAAHLDAAYRVVCEDIVKHLLARSAIAEWTGTQWTLRTATSPDSAIDYFINDGNASANCSEPFFVYQSVLGEVTLLPLQAPDAPRLVLAIEGDWSYLRDGLVAGAPLIALGLQVVRERVTRQENASLLVDGYAMIRRLSRLGTVEAVARAVVRETAELLGAERVSLALFNEADQSLTIAATEGVALNSLKEVRIVPGDWVVGHVFASRRPVFVSDVATLPGFRSNSTTYRTCSFAAVPLLAGSEAVGVLTVTDKRGHTVFTRQDELVLRTLGSAAAIAVVAARAGDEVTRLGHAATVDFLTGLLNRPGFDNRLHQEVERARRESGPLAVLMGDVDDFKTINDTRGHQVGDEVLKLVGSVIRSSVRVFDVCARYGGDEFAVVMPNSDRQNAVLCAERIRQRLAERSASDQLPALTMSIGVTVIGEGDHVADLIARADQSLYRAKADGKNLVRTQTPLADESADRRAGDARVIDICARRDGPVTASAEMAAELRYVLVLDSQTERVSSCLQSVTPFRVGFLVARDGAQAAGIIARFGAPLLLVVDLGPPGDDGFALIDRLRDAHGDHSAVIAWAASRELREYASAHLNGGEAHVLAATAALPTIRLAIAHCLERKLARVDATGEKPPPRWTAEQVHRVTSELNYRAQQISPAPGVAVYLRAPGEDSYRASFSWNSDQAIPHSPFHLPRVFAEVTTHGRTVVSADLGMNSGPMGHDAQDALRGVAGCPVIWAAEVIGALCVFDVVPLAISDDQVAALEALARDAAQNVAAAAPDDGVPASALTVTKRAIATIPAGTPDWPPALLERVGGEFAVARELARTRRDRKELSVILFEFAPLAGENNLAESVQYASETLLRAIRQSDLPIRWSGSELLVVLPGLDGNAARVVAERVRAALQAGARHRVAVAGGVAELEDEEGFGEVVGRARERVSLAREHGHNRVH